VWGAKTSNAKAEGRFDKVAFVYELEKNEYISPRVKH
jgi:hypothetical protein